MQKWILNLYNIDYKGAAAEIWDSALKLARFSFQIVAVYFNFRSKSLFHTFTSLDCQKLYDTVAAAIFIAKLFIYIPWK